MRLLEAFDFGLKKLDYCSSSPEFESFIFLEESTGKRKEDILVGEEPMKDIEFFRFKDYLNRRIQGEPWQYIIGRMNFLGLDIFTEKGVFIPRPETELMAARAISKLKKIRNPHILEIGCGTGVISVYIASRINKARIVATDISKKAVRLCKKNIDYLKLSDCVNVVCADLFECLNVNNKFDMIISNPPYIMKKDLERVDSLVKKEPFLALDGGTNGVKIVNEILGRSVEFLKKDGVLFLEIDPSNLSYIEIPDSFTSSFEYDQYNKIRYLHGVKL